MKSWIVYLIVPPLLASPAYAAQNCETALARVAKVELQKLVDQKKNDACKRLNVLALHHTKELKLNSSKICEDGPKVSASVDFSFTCATGDDAIIKASVSSDISADANVDFHSCAVEVSKLNASNSTLQQAMDAIGAKTIISSYISSVINPYCDH